MGKISCRCNTGPYVGTKFFYFLYMSLLQENFNNNYQILYNLETYQLSKPQKDEINNLTRKSQSMNISIIFAIAT